MLPHTVTLWNETGKGTTVHGVKQKQYQKTILRYVWLDFRKITNVLQTGDVAADSLLLFIFNGVSVATDEAGSIRNYTPPETFLNASEDEQKTLWTLNDGNDFITIGRADGDFFEGKNSTGGETSRKNYKVKIVDSKYSTSDVIHHWEVSGV